MIRTKINNSNEDMVSIKITNENKHRPFGIPGLINENTKDLIIFDISDYNLFHQCMEKSDYDKNVFKESFLQSSFLYMSSKGNLHDYKNCFIELNINNQKIDYYYSNVVKNIANHLKNECDERIIKVPFEVVEELNNQIPKLFNFENGTKKTFNFTKQFDYDKMEPKLLRIAESNFYELKTFLARKVPTFNYFRHSNYISISEYFSLYFHLFYGVLYTDPSYLKYILKNIYNESQELLSEIKNGMLPIFDVMDCEVILLYPIITDYAKLKINKACEELGL